MWHTWKSRQLHRPTELWYKALKEKDNLEESSIHCNIIFKWVVECELLLSVTE